MDTFSPHQPHSLASPWTWAVPALASITFTIVWGLDINRGLFLWLNDLGHGALAEMFWANATILGDALVAFTLLGFFARRRPDIVWALLLAALFATLWAQGLKHLIGNLRPLGMLSTDMVNVIGVALHKNSFPSGHTTTVFTLAGVICLQRVNPILAISALILAALAGISRAAVGAHWPLDIIAGAFGGWLAAVIGVYLARRWPAPGSTIGKSVIGLILLSCGFSLLFLHDTQYPQAYFFQIAIGVFSVGYLSRHLFDLYQQHSTNKRSRNKQPR